MQCSGGGCLKGRLTKGFCHAALVLASIVYAVPGGSHRLDRRVDGSVVSVVRAVPAAAESALYGAFIAAPSFPVGESPASLAAAKLTGDAQVELVVADKPAQLVKIFAYDPFNHLRLLQSIPVSGHPATLAVGDVNQDGIPDIVAVHSLESTMSILLGDLAGGYAESMVSAGQTPTDVVVADLDGNPSGAEIAVLSSGTAEILVFTGSGSPLRLQTGRPFGLVAYDIDRNGLMDLAAANTADNDVSLFLQTVPGNYVSQRIPVGRGPVALAFALFNDDALTDMAVSNATDGTVQILWGSAAGFSSAQVLRQGLVRPSRIVARDFNADGVPDLAVTDYGVIAAAAKSNRLTVFSGSRTDGFTFREQVASGINPVGMIAEDVTLDGRPDLVVVNKTSRDLIVYPGHGDGSFGVSPSYAAGSAPHWVEIADFNLDGIPDVATANLDTTNISVLLGNADGSLGARQLYELGVSPHAVTAGDVNGDGIPDLITANIGGNTVSVLLGLGNGTFDLARNIVVGDAPHVARLADLDHDGIIDLVVPTVHHVAILKGNGNGEFSPVGAAHTGDGASDALIADLNGDGHLDILVSHFHETYVAEYLGRGDGTFAKGRDINVTGGQHSIVLADVDANGTMDLVGTLFYAGQLFVIRDFSSSPQPILIMDVGALPSTIAVADLNGDAIPDLIVVTELENAVKIIRGDAGGALSVSGVFIPGNRPSAAVVSDMNRDGLPDIVVSNWYNDTVTVLFRQ